MFDLLPTAVKLTHSIIEKRLLPGARAIDATVGNGHDTLFLARAVGSTGRVFGFDIQETATANTRALLIEEQCSSWVTLYNSGHEEMGNYITDPVEVIMFNLGYLPGSDHSIITQPDTTIKALRQALKLLKPGGLLSIILYPGHAGGDLEADAVEGFVSELSKKQYACLKANYLNRSEKTPYMLLVEKG